ncbi:MAG TPA: preprotein translocase subunit SecA [Candidatus Paceibacterota bacterium]|jgi:preprotein translocase subunit SecA|nr:preprotein translocase subunit SecA [Candidatus Paceibacterota bacterium]
MAFSLQSLFDRNQVKGYQNKAEKIGHLEERLTGLSDEQFPLETENLKTRLSQGESLDDILPEAFALVREAAKRTMNKRHYDVQLIGGMVLHEGTIAEMRTGEGKTMVATLPVYLNALSGRGVHVVTVNDYLARRDATWMGQIYNFLGLSIGVINDLNNSFVYDPAHQELDEERDEEGSFKVVKQFLRPVSRKEAYQADITYGTNSQFGFDYLRDNLVTNKEDIVQREHYFAVVDEVDSILIDESRTPLIISSPISESESLYKTVRDVANKLEQEKDYLVDEKMKAITLTDDGITKAEKLLGISDMYTEKGIKYAHYLETAVRAKALFTKDKDYVVKDGEVIIVDTFTGRMQPGRRWSEGLHQAIEAKEGVKVEQETRSVASITYQNYFKLYEKLSGMTGTAKTSEEEFMKVYNLGVITIPTHRPIKRIDHNDLIFQTEKGKFEAIARAVKELNAKGQPVLIGTVSIEKNELLAAYLKRVGVPHQVLNAKNHENEGSVIAQAGKKGSVVIATNLAGRGVDIILGGTSATPEEQQAVKDLGGLYVIGTERHEARRIDNQLRGRSGRQGDPGETQFYVSLEDDLMRVFGSERLKSMMNRFGLPEDQPIDNGFVSSALETAQKKIEGFHFDARKHTLEYDTVLSFQRTIIYDRRRAMVQGDKGHIITTFYGLGEMEALEPVVKEKIALIGEEAFWEQVRRVVLYTTDTLWVEHIDTMEHMRQSVGLRAYGQREPLVEYKKEATRLFKEMEQRLKDQVITMVTAISK